MYVIREGRWENDYQADDRSQQTERTGSHERKGTTSMAVAAASKVFQKNNQRLQQQTNTPKTRAGYELDMSRQQAINELIECLRPAGPSITAHFVNLYACKPMFDAVEERMGIAFDALYNDLKDNAEVAVVLALDNLRTVPGRYFPSFDEIIKTVSEYREMIYSALNFFKE